MQSPVQARLVIGPNASLSGRQACLVMGLMCVVGFGIASMFAMLGFWPILPFAGLELGAFGAALWVVQRRNRYREVLSFTDDTVRIEFGMLGKGAQAQVEMPRAWTRAGLEPGATVYEPMSLLLSCSGQRVEIGRCLTDVERERLCARVRELLKPAGLAGKRAGPSLETS